MLEDAAEEVFELPLALSPLSADSFELALLALVALAARARRLPLDILAVGAVVARALAAGRFRLGERLWRRLARGGCAVAALVKDARELDILEVLSLRGLGL